jgi:GNAT superfamily N-acetyltransferase
VEIQIIEEDQTALKEYGRVPISFTVKSRLRVELVNTGLGGFAFTEEAVSPEYVKDYDGEEDAGPERWAKIWDLSNWGVLSAFENGSRIGGGVMAYDTEGVYMLEGRKDLAALWDLRVHPDYRQKGVGARIFQSAVSWAAERGCDFLKVETQNINVPACTFYVKQGCSLGAVNRFAYPDLPHEVQLIWYKKMPG